MRRIFSCVNAIALAVVVGLSACTDQRTPFEPEVSGPFFSEQPAPGFTVLERTRALKSSISVTRTIGSRGGKIEIKEAGIVLEIPKGALRTNTPITVTALKGTALAFVFSPHPLRFSKPATIRLDVKGTTAEKPLKPLMTWVKKNKVKGPVPLDSFIGVYFEGDGSGSVRPMEIIETFLEGKQIGFKIDHFSGYAVAGGK